MSYTTSVDGLDCPFYVCYQVAVSLSEYIRKWGWPDNKPIYRGYVFLTIKDLMELIASNAEKQRTRRASRSTVKSVMEQSQAETDVQIDLSDKPPCIIEVETKLRDGVEVGHFERFLLATWYFRRFGERAVEMLVELLKHAPDFDPKKTEYQLRHISGQVGGRKKYSVPSCNTVMANGACPVGGSCGVRSPALYGRRRRGLGKLVISNRRGGGDER